MRPSVTTTAALAAGAVGWALPAPAAHLPALADALGMPRTRPGLDGVAITFDDGPHPIATPRIAQLLADGGAKATFFMLGHQVRRTGGLAAEVASAGHTIALHGDQHPNALWLSPQQVLDDVRRGQETIERATGVAPQLYRPPFGILSLPALRAVRAAGFEVLLWSRWGRDWTSRATARSVASRVLAPGPLTAGAVILLHDADDHGAPDCWESTAGALPAILDAITQAGLHTTPL